MFKDSLLVRTAQDEQSGLEPVAKKAIRRPFQHSIHELNFQPEVEVLAVQKGSVRSASQRTNGAWDRSIKVFWLANDAFNVSRKLEELRSSLF